MTSLQAIPGVNSTSQTACGLTAYRLYDYLTEMTRYTYRDRVAAIACPTLICCTATDPLAVQSADLYRALAAPKEHRVFESAAGAGAHTEAGATGQFEKEIFCWACRTSRQRS